MLRSSCKDEQPSQEFAYKERRMRVAVAYENVRSQGPPKQVTADTAREVFGRDVEQELIRSRRVGRNISRTLPLNYAQDIYGVQWLCHTVDLLEKSI